MIAIRTLSEPLSALKTALAADKEQGFFLVLAHGQSLEVKERVH